MTLPPTIKIVESWAGILEDEDYRAWLLVHFLILQPVNGTNSKRTDVYLKVLEQTVNQEHLVTPSFPLKKHYDELMSHPNLPCPSGRQKNLTGSALDFIRKEHNLVEQTFPNDFYGTEKSNSVIVLVDVDGFSKGLEYLRAEDGWAFTVKLKNDFGEVVAVPTSAIDTVYQPSAPPK